jgi:tRNA (guanine37-N1)-methyltransferase
MRIDIISLFPEMFGGPFGGSIIKRAVDKGILDIRITNPRDFAYDKHKQVDDSPFGGGSGMVLKPEPMFRAVQAVRENTAYAKRRILLMCPSGKTFSQDKAKQLAGYEQLILICGHYEGFDARITQYLADEALSVGDYVLTGGELPAMIVTDAVSRMLPGVLGSEESASTDSFYEGILEFPQYTRPREYEGMPVPEVLLSGDHARIRQWRRREALRLTLSNRPDLLRKIELSEADRAFLAELQKN